MKKIIISIVFLFLLLPIVNADGLKIIDQDISVDKTYGVDKAIQLSIRNEESFTIANITFEEDWIEVSKFDLDSGENKTITATITRDTDYEGQITLIGDYYVDMGQNYEPKTEIVHISWDDEYISPCHLDLIIGDSVNWTNLHTGTIKLINDETKSEIATISAESSLVYEPFNSPILLKYYATYVGWKFTPVCKINVMNTKGWVHNSIYDGTANLNLKINYEPTQIQTTFFDTSYNITYGKSVEDIFKIKNTGSKIAKDIHLSGEWFSFGENDFDLSPGQSRNIEYTITPIVYKTNDTDKTHTKTIKIEGNFETIDQKMEIYIPYKNLDSIFSGEVDEDVIIEFFKYLCSIDYDMCVGVFCSQYPEECEGGSLKDSNITQSFSASTIKGLIEGYAESEAKNEKARKTQLETDEKQTNAIISLNTNYNQTNKNIKEMKEEQHNLSVAMIFQIIFMMFVMALGILYYLYRQGSINSIKKKLGFGRGEMP